MSDDLSACELSNINVFDSGLFHIYNPIRRTFCLDIFQHVFENKIPDKSENHVQKRSYVVAVHQRDTFPFVRFACL